MGRSAYCSPERALSSCAAWRGEGLINTKLFVAAGFIAFCVLAVALLGTAV
jgi:hypothetical protein